MSKIYLIIFAFLGLFTGCSKNQPVKALQTYVYEEDAGENNLFRLILKEIDKNAGEYHLEYYFKDDEKPIFNDFLKTVSSNGEFSFFEFSDCLGNEMNACFKSSPIQNEISFTCKKLSKKGRRLKNVYDRSYVFESELLDKLEEVYADNFVFCRINDGGEQWVCDSREVVILEKNETEVNFSLIRSAMPGYPEIIENFITAKKAPDKYYYEFEFIDDFENEVYGYMIFRDNVNEIEFMMSRKQMPISFCYAENLYIGMPVSLAKCKRNLAETKINKKEIIAKTVETEKEFDYENLKLSEQVTNRFLKYDAENNRIYSPVEVTSYQFDALCMLSFYDPERTEEIVQALRKNKSEEELFKIWSNIKTERYNLKTVYLLRDTWKMFHGIYKQ